MTSQVGFSPCDTGPGMGRTPDAAVAVRLPLGHIGCRRLVRARRAGRITQTSGPSSRPLCQHRVVSASYDATVLTPDPVRRRAVMDVVCAGIEAVEPAAAVRRAMHRDGPALVVGSEVLNLSGVARVRVIGLGKASIAMTAAIESIFPELPLEGAVVAPAAATLPRLHVVAGRHPVPDRSSIRGAELLMEQARASRSDELLVVAISGGGSALATLPLPGITLSDMRSITDALLRSGATIDELNVVRKHLDGIKGGRLLEAAAGARAVVTLVLSDVVGNPLDIIASGPTVPDSSTYTDALQVLDEHGLTGVSPAVTAVLERGRTGDIDDTPAAGSVFRRQLVHIVADAATAAHAAAGAASAAGIPAEVVTTTMTGEAREVAAEIVAEAPDAHGMAIYAGETTVTVAGQGRGGRNQELALAAGIALAGVDDLVVASVGTDGRDGPTDASGGIGDGNTMARAGAAGLDAVAFLADNDSHRLLAATGDLVITGPTGTNVGDLTVVYRAGH